MNVTRRGFLKGVCAAATAAAAAPHAFARAAARPRHDPNLVLFLSDSHVNGCLDAYEQHERASLANVVEKILKLDPLPARAIHFGDLAYLWGRKEDYTLAKELLRPLVDAGIELTIGMGNHDRRSTFLEVFPEYAKTTKVPGRIVSVVDAGAVDFVMLDGLMGADDRALDNMGPGGAEFSAAQQEWMVDMLPKWKKPVFVCSHWPLGGIKVKDAKFHRFLISCPMVAGYIHGHDHRWRKDFAHENWKGPRLVKTLCLPSTGHWGDIGFALMRIDGADATVSLHQHDFFFPEPEPKLPGANFALWKHMVRENQGLKCTFVLPKA